MKIIIIIMIKNEKKICKEKMEFGYCPNCIAIQLLHWRQLGRLGRTGVGAGRAGQAGGGCRASGSWALGERAQGAGACHAQARCRRTDARGARQGCSA